MRTLTPTGEVLVGQAAAAAVRGAAHAGASADVRAGAPPDARAGGSAGILPTASIPGLPVFFLGSSRGTMASGWAMTINFDKDCSYDLPTITCKPPARDPNIKGAILIADFSSGVGYLESETTPKDDGRGPGRDRGLFIGGIEVENNIVFFPSSAILAGIHTWPSAFFARGLWCYADGLEGEMDAYSRVRGLKDLVVLRGPHPFEAWPAEEKARVTDRAIAYAKAVVLGPKTIPGRRTRTNMKELVATPSDVWEPSTHPTVVFEPVTAVKTHPRSRSHDRSDLPRVIEAIGTKDFAAETAGALCEFLGFELTAVFVHRRACAPSILFDNFAAAEARRGIDNYVRFTHKINPMLARARPESVYRARDFTLSLEGGRGAGAWLTSWC